MSEDLQPVDPFNPLGKVEKDIYGKEIISDEEYIKRYGQQEFEKWVKRNRDSYLAVKMNENAQKKFLKEVAQAKRDKRDSELAKEHAERMKRLVRVHYK
jgi:hypothetical protein